MAHQSSLGLKFADLADLHLQGRAGLNNSIVTFPSGAPRVEPLFDLIIKKARELSAGFLIADNRAQLILGDENDRMVATCGGNLCAMIARETGAALLLVGHPAKPTDSQYSGSTGWDAVNRSRWWLQQIPNDDDNKDAPPQLLLALAKTNYAPEGAAVTLEWRQGVMRAVDASHMTAADVLELKLRQGAARQAFLDALDQATAEGRPVSHSQQARNFAPKMFAGKSGFSKRELETAMEELFAESRIIANAIIGRTAKRQAIRGIARFTAEPDEEPE